MSEMVERVARALCEDCGLDWSAASQDSWRRWLHNVVGAVLVAAVALLIGVGNMQ